MFNNILNFLKSLVSLKKKNFIIHVYNKNINFLNSMKINISIRTYIYSVGKLLSKIKITEDSYNHMYLFYYLWFNIIALIFIEIYWYFFLNT